MGLNYHFVLPPTGQADNSIVREMFDDVKQFVDNLTPSGSAAPIDATYLTLTTNATLTNERVLTAGTAISFTDNGAGSTLIINNIGVTSLSTTNINSNFSASTGAITFSFSTTPTFSSIILQSATGAIGITPSASSFTSYNLTLPLDTGTSGYILRTNGATPTATLTWVAQTAVKAITGTAEQISVDNSGDPIILSTPQDIGLSSNVQFGSLRVGAGSASDVALKINDTNTGFYQAISGVGDITLELDGTDTTMWTKSNLKLWNAGPIQSKSFIFYDIAGSHPTVTINPPSGFTSYTLTLPVDDGTPNQTLTTDGSGVLSWSTASGTGANTALSNLASVAINTSLLPGITGSIDLGSATKLWQNTFLRTLVIYDSDVATNKITIIAPTSVTNHTLTLPGTQGASSTVLQNNGSGTLSWSAIVNSLTGTSNQVIVSASTGSITLSLPQNINTGATPTFASETLTATTNQLILGTTRTVTFTAPTPSTSSRVITFPDQSADYSVVATAGTQTISGTKTFDGQLIGKGTATNDNAAAGYIGEYISSSVSAQNVGTSNQYSDITSITLGAGDWDVSGMTDYVSNGATVTAIFFGFGTVTGNSSTGIVIGDNSTNILPATTASNNGGGISPVRYSLSTSTTIYFKQFITYTLATPLVYGRISGRRVR